MLFFLPGNQSYIRWGASWLCLSILSLIRQRLIIITETEKPIWGSGSAGHSMLCFYPPTSCTFVLCSQPFVHTSQSSQIKSTMWTRALKLAYTTAVFKQSLLLRKVCEISCEYRSGSHDESWSNSPKSASFLISFSRGYTRPSLDNALCQFLAALMYSKCSRILVAQRLSLLSPYAFSSTFLLYLMTFSIKVKEEMFFQKT